MDSEQGLERIYLSPVVRSEKGSCFRSLTKPGEEILRPEPIDGRDLHESRDTKMEVVEGFQGEYVVRGEVQGDVEEGVSLEARGVLCKKE